MRPLQKLRSRLRRGQVYRREDLVKWSTSVDRHLKELVEAGELSKLAGGLYYRPKKTVFGNAPAEDTSLIAAFLKDTRFLVTSSNAYNALGVGSTQLYNETVVYNHRRHGQFKLGGRIFDFRMKPDFPKALTKEFLMVDLVNNIDRLAEDRDAVLEHVEKLVADANTASLCRAARRYGSVRTRKFFEKVTSERTPRHGR